MRLLGSCHLANRHHILGVSLVLAALLTLSWLGMRHSPSDHRPVYVRMRERSGAPATVSQVAAPYVSPADLLAGRAEFGHTSGRGVPMLIHQSWMNRDMPIKFKRWSDTWRAKHPEWKWVSMGFGRGGGPMRRRVGVGAGADAGADWRTSDELLAIVMRWRSTRNCVLRRTME